MRTGMVDVKTVRSHAFRVARAGVLCFVRSLSQAWGAQSMQKVANFGPHVCLFVGMISRGAGVRVHQVILSWQARCIHVNIAKQYFKF